MELKHFGNCSNHKDSQKCTAFVVQIPIHYDASQTTVKDRPLPCQSNILLKQRLCLAGYTWLQKVTLRWEQSWSMCLNWPVETGSSKKMLIPSINKVNSIFLFLHFLLEAPLSDSLSGLADTLNGRAGRQRSSTAWAHPLGKENHKHCWLRWGRSDPAQRESRAGRP